MLKAIFVYKNGTTPPKIHNLLLLAERSDLQGELNESQLDFLSEVNTYQLEGRYPIDRELLFQNTPIDNFKTILHRTEVELKWFELRLKSNKS